jgi:hypothetical protein
MTTIEEEEQNAKEFCEELRALLDVCEVRGCTRQRMGQSLIGIGVSCIKDDVVDLEKTKAQSRAIMKAWFRIIEEED